MASTIRNLSIRRKQMLIIMLTSSVTLLLACAAFVAYDTFTFRHLLIKKESSVADVVGKTVTAAIDFNDVKTAEESLAALRAEPNVISACIYDGHGSVFATYQRDNDTTAGNFPALRAPGYEFVGSQLYVFQDIKQRDGRVGAIFISSDLDELSQRLKNYAGIVGFVFLASLLIALALSDRLQRVISGPVLNLAQVARAVALEKNYSLRAQKQSHDELGQLVDWFNEMLAQIQHRDAALQTARTSLEQRVVERTDELAQSLSLLHATLESTTDGILALDLTGKITSSNAKFVALWRFPAEFLERRDDAEMLAYASQQVKDPEKFLTITGRAAGASGTGTFELVELKDGRILERYSLPQKIGDRRVGTVVNWRDITERKRAEEALHESQALYLSLVDQMPAGVFRKDEAGRYVFVNSWYCQIKGMPADQILGRTPKELAAFELAGKDVKNLETPKEIRLAAQGVDHHGLIMASGQRIEIGEDYPGVDGRMQHLHVVKSPVFGPDGKIIGSQGMLFDITERKQAEAGLAYEQGLLRALLDNSPDQIYFKDTQSRFLKSSRAQAENFGVKDAATLIGKTDFDFFAAVHAQVAFDDEQEIIRTGRPVIGKVEKEVLPDGRTRWVIASKMPFRDKDGQIIGTLGISKDITALKQTEDELAYERDLLRALLDNFPDSIYFKDRQSRFVRLSRSKVVRTFTSCLEQNRASSAANPLPAHLENLESFSKFILGKTDLDFLPEKFAREMYADEQELIRTGTPLIGKVDQFQRPDGTSAWTISTKMLWKDKGGKTIGTFGTTKDITSIKEAEAKVEAAHKQLIETSRRAGMAEVATNVLHNVGNVLNSINVSAALVADNAKKSKAPYLGKVVTLLNEHASDLGTFMTTDPKGRQVPGYLGQLADQLVREQQGAITELDLLRQNIEHIKDIVAMQQNYAKISGVSETVKVSDLVEDALRMNAGALARHEVELVREYSDTPPVIVEKHKVLQILVNLIRNAKYACDDSGRQDKQLTVRVSRIDDGVRIAVVDNGIGIPPENLARIFNHGFTTRKGGHGFGLHSGALAAKELGGALTVHSDGPGCGAAFTLKLPLQPPLTDL